MSDLETLLHSMQYLGIKIGLDDSPPSILNQPVELMFARKDSKTSEAKVIWRGFDHLNTDPNGAELWKSMGQAWHSVCGHGLMLVSNPLFFPTFEISSELSQGDREVLVKFLDSVIHQIWKLPPPFYVSVDPDLFYQDDGQGIVIDFTVAAVCSEEEWQRGLRLRELELEAAKALQAAMLSKQLLDESAAAPNSKLH